MELGVYGVIAVAVIVAVAAFSKKLGIAAPIILVVVGVALSYLPGVPEIEVPHEVILDGVLPPILYAAAISVPITDFRRNLGPIASLSVVLVIVTAFAAGFLLYGLFQVHIDLYAANAVGKRYHDVFHAIAIVFQDLRQRRQHLFAEAVEFPCIKILRLMVQLLPDSAQIAFFE